MNRSINFCALIILTTLTFCALAASAQTSGWEDKGGYKEQKLKIGNLKSIRFTEDGNYFHTLHGNDTICTWQTKTGELLDNFVVPNAKGGVYLSKDGKTLCYYNIEEAYLRDSMKISVNLYDISNETWIANDTLSAPDDIVCQLPYIGSNNGWIDLGYKVNILDYNYQGQFLTCGVSFVYYYSVSRYSETYLYYITCGGLARLEVLNGRFNRSAILSTITSDDFIETPKANFITSKSNEINEEVTGSVRSKSEITKFFLSKHDLINDSSLSLLSYTYSNATVSYGSTNDTYITGFYCPLNRLFFSANTDNLFVKTDRNYLILNSKTNSLTDSISLLSLNGFEDLNYDGSKFYYIANNKIIEHDIASKTVLDSLPCQISPNNMVLVPNGGGLIITAIDGSMAYYDSLNRSPEFKGLAWVDRGSYIENANRIPGLKSIAYSGDGKTFYTLHNDKTVYYWDMASGAIIDSLIITDKNVYGTFSRDGKSVIFCTSVGRYYWFPESTIWIYDLAAKTLVAKDTVRMPRDFACALPDDYGSHFGWYSDKIGNMEITLLDFVKERNEISLGFGFHFSDMMSSITVEENTYHHLGGSAIFEIEGDTFSLKKQVSLRPTHDIIYTSNDIFYTTEKYVYRSYRDMNISTRNETNYIYLLNKTQYKSSDSTTLAKGGFIANSSWSEHSGSQHSESGCIRPFTTLLHDSTNNRLFMKADSIYYIFDLTTDKQIDSLVLPAKNCMEKFNKNFSKVIYYFNGKIYSKSVQYDYLTDSLKAPFEPNSLSLVPNSEDIALTSDSGRIAIFKKFNSIPGRPPLTTEIFLRPNPAREEIYLPNDVELRGTTIEIYSPTGVKALEAPYSESINISTLPAGVYFLRAGNKIGKFIKE